MPNDARIYLDHAATTPLRPEVWEAMSACLAAVPGNPSSLHAEGRQARARLEDAREAMRATLGAQEYALCLTGGGTEADNAAVLGVLLARLRQAPHAPVHVVASAVEHPAVLGALENAATWGVEHTLVPVDGRGRVAPERVLEALRPTTALVTVMTVQNEVGTRQPVEAIARELRAREILFHTDAVQWAGKETTSLGALGADLVSLSAHKIYGPKGVGALLVRQGVSLEPLLRGSQETGLRGGTENVAGAVGFARALDLAVAEAPSEVERLTALRQRFCEALPSRLDGVRFLSPSDVGVPHIVTAAFAGVEGASLLHRLDALGVSVSTGSACNSGAAKPSRVLAALGLDAETARGSIRFSFGRATTADVLDDVLERIVRAVAALREISPAAPRR